VTIALPRMNRLPAAERGITIGDFLVPIRLGETLSARVRHAVLILVGALFVALTAQITIRLPIGETPIPITGQTFGVLLVGGALGLRRGALALLLYLALGLALPFYAGGESGVDRFVVQEGGRWALFPSGGYLLGFVFAAALVGWLAELGWDRRLIGSLGALALGNVLIYVVGTGWLMAAAGYDLATGVAKGVTPFLIGDAIKLVAAAVLFPAAWWIVGHRPGER
jgi:biotin transport system substrate-specific component